MQDVFSEIYQSNFWRDDESVSGSGSNFKQTAVIRQELPKLFERLGVQTMLDIPCGDFHWISDLVPNIDYIGADIVPELIASNRNDYPDIDFRVLDITSDHLPMVDLVLCRDLLGHFSNREVQRALKNLRSSGSTYLLATTFPGRENAQDIITGQWRPINLASYFGLPDPVETLNEGLEGKFSDKSLGLWRLS